jgi:glycosyltransferase involved in cell wall biosynthesis
LKISCELSRLDTKHPTGIAVYAGFVLDLLRASEKVELVSQGAAEVFLSLDGHFRARRGQVTVTTIYDLGHLVERRAYSGRDWLRQSWQVASAARRSHHLLVPSSAVGYGLEHYLGVPANRITVLEPLPAPLFRRSSAQETAALRRELGLPGRYFVFVGRRSRRKNLPLLERAWELASRRLPGEVGLVLAGPGDQSVAGTTDIGYIERERLPALLSGAMAWLSPSFYEGCSIGALEAMACGTPPLVAGAGAPPRAVDQAGLILDPHDPDQWAEAMITLAENDRLRASLSNTARKAIAERRAHPPDPGELLAALGWRADP